MSRRTEDAVLRTLLSYVSILAFVRVWLRSYFIMFRNYQQVFNSKICTSYLLRVTSTAWKESEYGVFSGPYLCIQSEYRKIPTRKNKVFEHFSRSVLTSRKSVFINNKSEGGYSIMTINWVILQVGNYKIKVNPRNTRKRCEICSKVTMKTPERRHGEFKKSMTPCII